MRALFTFALAAFALRAESTRLRDLVSLEGVRDNQLMGYGLVVGLNGTGDKQLTLFSAQSLGNLLNRMGVTINSSQMQVRNVAAVMVTATLPPFAQPGTKLDIIVGALGDARSLQGGLLLLTPLKAGDGQTYAVAQGPVITNAFVAGRGGNSASVNHPTMGRTPDGAIVEKAPPSITPAAKFKLQLHQADFITAARVVAVLNAKYAGAVAKAESPGVIVVDVPQSFSGKSVEFVADLENLIVDADRPSRVAINERTGTIVMGKDVKIAPVAIMHGNMSVEIRTKLDVSQPAPLSQQGKTAVTPQVDVAAKEDKAKSVVLDKGATVEELVRALQAIGSTPRDVIAVLQNLKAAGALDATIEVL